MIVTKELKIGAVSIVENEAKSLGKGPDFLSEQATAAAHRIHQELPGYQRVTTANPVCGILCRVDD